MQEPLTKACDVNCDKKATLSFGALVLCELEVSKEVVIAAVQAVCVLRPYQFIHCI